MLSDANFRRLAAYLLGTTAFWMSMPAFAQDTIGGETETVSEQRLRLSDPNNDRMPLPPRTKDIGLKASAKKEPAKLVVTPAWLFVPRVRVEELVTDNATNGPFGTRSDLVSIAGLGGTLIGDTPRINLHANYLGTYSKFLENTNEDHFTQTLHATGDATIVPNFAFLDFQAFADLLGRDGEATSGSAALNPDNSVQTYVIAFSPFARYQIGRWGDLELRAASNFTWFTGHGGSTGSSSGVIGDGNQQQGKIEFTMPGTIAPQLLMEAYVSAQYTDSAHIEIFRRNQGQGIGEYQLTRSLSIIGAGGHENFIDSAILSASGEGPIWSTGFRWRPNADSSVILTYGRYDLKDDFAGEAQYRVTPSTLLYAAYTDSIATSQQQLAGGVGASSFIQNGNLSQQILSDAPIAGVTFDENPVIATLNRKFIEAENAINGKSTDIGNINTLTGIPVLDTSSYFPLLNALYRLKSFRAAVYRLLDGDVVSFQAYHNSRDVLSAILPTTQVSDGLKLSYTAQLTKYLDGYAGGGYQVVYTDVLFSPHTRTYSWTGSVGLHYDLAENLRAFARYDYNGHDFVEGTATSSMQNSLGLGLTWEF